MANTHIINGRCFCVYYHYLNSVVFYVGMGNLQRAFDFGARTRLWRNYVNPKKKGNSKLSARDKKKIEVKFVLFKNRNDALKFEKQEIDRLQPFCNQVGKKDWKFPHRNGHKKSFTCGGSLTYIIT